MKILSIRQPWAWLIVNGFKDIENRTWQTKHRGGFFVHAGQTMTAADFREAEETVRSIDKNILSDLYAHAGQLQLQRGGIVGYAEITDCVSESASPWFFGDYGFSLANARPLPFTPLKGRLGFFEAPAEIERLLLSPQPGNQ